MAGKLPVNAQLQCPASASGPQLNRGRVAGRFFVGFSVFHFLTALCLIGRLDLSRAADAGSNEVADLHQKIANSNRSESTVLDLAQLDSLPEWLARKGFPVELEAWIVSARPESGLLRLRDAKGSFELYSSKYATQVRVGQRVKVEGLTGWQTNHSALNLTRFDPAEPLEPHPQLLSPGAPVLASETLKWVETSGRVTSIGSEKGASVRMEITSGQRHLIAQVMEPWPRERSELLHQRIRLRGLAQAVLNQDASWEYGLLWVGGWDSIEMDTARPVKALTAIDQIMRLTAAELQPLNCPVLIRGVAIGGVKNYLQDATGGIYVGNEDKPMKFGGFYEIEGVAGPGLYAPLVEPTRITYLGPGKLPAPIHPTMDQLGSGSVQCQWMEVSGIIHSIDDGQIVLATSTGNISAQVLDADTNYLASLESAIVRIQGSYHPEFNSQQQLTGYWIDVPSASFITVESRLSADAFGMPITAMGDISKFSVDAGEIHSIKLTGQVTYKIGKVGYLSDGTNSVRFNLKKPTALQPGDFLEAVGIPELGGAAVSLRETIVRKTGSAALTPPPLSTVDQLLTRYQDSARMRIRGRVLSVSRDTSGLVLQLGLSSKMVTARIQGDCGTGQADQVIPPNSFVELVGICVGQLTSRVSGDRLDGFEFLVQSINDVAILKKPSWWTPQHWLMVASLMGGILLAALVWIQLLRIKVEKRTQELKSEILGRERAEIQRSVEQERVRIARDLHDDLGASLTEISMLAETGRDCAPAPGNAPKRFGQILTRSQTLVNKLDEMVWVVDPRKDNLPSLAKYLAGYAEEFAATAGLACRVEMPVSIPEYPLNAEARHSLFLAVKETLNNTARHAFATEVSFQITVDPHGLEIKIADDGCGFDPKAPADGNGLLNLRERLARLGGHYAIASTVKGGTTVVLSLPLPRNS